MVESLDLRVDDGDLVAPVVGVLAGEALSVRAGLCPAERRRVVAMARDRLAREPGAADVLLADGRGGARWLRDAVPACGRVGQAV